MDPAVKPCDCDHRRETAYNRKMQVGIIGWRGMVGSVLVQRMREERDFDLVDPVFFSTSQAGDPAPGIGKTVPAVKNALDVTALAAMDVLISCQGGEYTADIHPKLRSAGWKGYWIDAARQLRMSDDAVIILDPVNRDVIDRALDRGLKDFIGGNCTVSLMLMAMDGLFRADLIEWTTSMTYQAASGGGAKHMRELVSQMGLAHASVADLLADPASSILDIDRELIATQRGPQLPCRELRASRSPAACSPGSTPTWATDRAAKSGRRRPKATRSSVAPRDRFRSMASACASDRCDATARR